MKAAKIWTQSKVQRLYRHISSTYYARVSIAGKETWWPLKTKVFEIAKPEFKKLKEDVGHKIALAREITLDEYMTGAAAIGTVRTSNKCPGRFVAGQQRFTTC